jgi:AcrR family transcriptional regulator
MDEPRSSAAERLVEAALQLFAEKGYERTSVSEIQAAAGLSAGSGALYKHFPSKEAVLAAIVDRYLAAATAALSGLAKLDLPPREGLAWIARSTLRVMAQRQAELRIFWRDLDRFPELQGRVRHGIIQASYKGVGDWLRRQVETGAVQIPDCDAAAALLLGSLTMFRVFEALWGERVVDIPDERFLAGWQLLAERMLGLQATPG